MICACIYVYSEGSSLSLYTKNAPGEISISPPDSPGLWIWYGQSDEKGFWRRPSWGQAQLILQGRPPWDEDEYFNNGIDIEPLRKRLQGALQNLAPFQQALAKIRDISSQTRGQASSSPPPPAPATSEDQA